MLYEDKYCEVEFKHIVQLEGIFNMFERLNKKS